MTKMTLESNGERMILSKIDIRVMHIYSGGKNLTPTL